MALSSAVGFDGSTQAAPDPERACAAATDTAEQQFPVTVSDNGRYLETSSGVPWLLVGDAGWSSAVMLDEAGLDHYFDGLAARRFNTVLVSLVEYWYSDSPPLNAAGEAPFVGDPFQSGLNEPYWGWIDHYLESAAVRGITVLATPAYLGYGEDGVAALVESATVDDMRAYGRSLGRRYAGEPNVIWVIGGDRSEVSPAAMERMNALAMGLREYSSQLITAHTADDASPADFYGHFSWLDLNNSYDTQGRVVESSLISYGQSPTRPTFAIEGIYEQERSDPRPPGNSLLRAQAYGSLLSGAFGHVFGNNPRWHFGSRSAPYPYQGTWQDSLDDPSDRLDLGTIHMCIFARVASTMPWWQLSPDVDRQFLVSGGGEGEGRAAAGYDVTTGWAAIYTVGTDTVSLHIGALEGASEVSITRIDPADGTRTDLGSRRTEGDAVIEHPGPNSHGDDDWLYAISPT